ncbi:hypothetical protein PG984_013197 [Apiospora sp. TS-2023a]
MKTRASLEKEVPTPIFPSANMFERFGKLAPELRQSIWKAFLEQESSHRLVMVNVAYGVTVEPHKQLVSPLLSVNRESRYCALKHYFLKHNVWASLFLGKGEMDEKDIAKVIREATDHDIDGEILNGEIPQPTTIGSLFLNPIKDTIILNYNDERKSYIRCYPAAVSAATQKPCKAPQVYFACMDISKFESVLTTLHIPYFKLRDETPASICQWLSSCFLWDDAEGVKRYLFTGEVERSRLRDFIQDIYFLDGETIWGKYNIREFAWAMLKRNDDETKPELALVDTTDLSSSTYATMRTVYGKYVECMIFEGDQAAEAYKASCAYNRAHPTTCVCLVDNDPGEDEATDDDADENSGEDEGVGEDAAESRDED